MPPDASVLRPSVPPVCSGITVENEGGGGRLTATPPHGCIFSGPRRISALAVSGPAVVGVAARRCLHPPRLSARASLPTICPPSSPPTPPPPRQLIGAAAAARSTDDLPVITAAGWTIYNGPAACPGGTTPCIELTVAGDNFGASQGQLQKGDFLAPPAPPPPQPWDTPAVLFPSDLATRVGGNGVCVARSLYTGDGFAYRFCPFQRVEHFLGNFANGNLGTYAGVVRDFNNVNCPGSNAIVGMKFLDGSMCNGAPSTSIVNFVCVDVLGAGLVDWGTRTPMIDSAVTPDQCNWNLTLPLPGACDGPRFALCGSAVASPNPTPAPSPQFSFAPATPLSWTAGLITALMPGTVPPPAVRIETSAGVLSTAVEPEAGTLPPSASPIPVPFPSTLEIISMTPQEGVRGACNPVVIQLAGVVLSDIVSQFNVVFRVRVPTGPNSAMNYNFQVCGRAEGVEP